MFISRKLIFSLPISKIKFFFPLIHIFQDFLFVTKFWSFFFIDLVIKWHVKHDTTSKIHKPCYQWWWHITKNLKAVKQIAGCGGLGSGTKATSRRLTGVILLQKIRMYLGSDMVWRDHLSYDYGKLHYWQGNSHFGKTYTQIFHFELTCPSSSHIAGGTQISTNLLAGGTP